jgi:membrane protein
MLYEVKDKSLLAILKFLRIKNPKLRSFIALIEIFIYRLNNNKTFLLAGGIAFNIALYIIPMLLTAIFILKKILYSFEETELLINSVYDILPHNEETYNIFYMIIEELDFIFSNSNAAGIIGIISLLWLSSILFSAIRTGLNTVFQIESPKIFFIYRFKDIAVTVLLSIYFLIYSYIFPLISIISTSFTNYLPESINFFFSNVFLTIVTIISSLIMFYIIYRFVPAKKVPFQVRAVSTVICVLLIEISKFFFELYISGITSYGKFYGTYALIALLGLWLYYLSVIILLSAEISKFIFDYRKKLI